MGILEREEREKEQSLLKEIIAENFPNWGRNSIYNSMMLREPLITSIQKELLQNTLY